MPGSSIKQHAIITILLSGIKGFTQNTINEGRRCRKNA
jgi:hypothetical protein